MKNILNTYGMDSNVKGEVIKVKKSVVKKKNIVNESHDYKEYINNIKKRSITSHENYSDKNSYSNNISNSAISDDVNNSTILTNPTIVKRKNSNYAKKRSEYADNNIKVRIGSNDDKIIQLQNKYLVTQTERVDGISKLIDNNKSQNRNNSSSHDNKKIIPKSTKSTNEERLFIKSNNNQNVKSPH